MLLFIVYFLLYPNNVQRYDKKDTYYIDFVVINKIFILLAVLRRTLGKIPRDFLNPRG